MCPFKAYNLVGFIIVTKFIHFYFLPMLLKLQKRKKSTGTKRMLPNNIDLTDLRQPATKLAVEKALS